MNETLTFTVTLRPEPEGGFTVRVTELPEIITHGDDETEALARAKEAIELVIESRTERGEPLPFAQQTLVRQVTVQRAA
jgi:antitoxin HicB